MNGKINLKIVLGVLVVYRSRSRHQRLFRHLRRRAPRSSSRTTPRHLRSSSAATFIFPSSTASSSSPSASASELGRFDAFGTFSSNFSAPYPVTWSEGQSSFAISGATLTGNELTLLVNVTVGEIPQCVPINLRLISDEQGDMAAPTSPTDNEFPARARAHAKERRTRLYPERTLDLYGRSREYAVPSHDGRNIEYLF